MPRTTRHYYVYDLAADEFGGLTQITGEGQCYAGRDPLEVAWSARALRSPGRDDKPGVRDLYVVADLATDDRVKAALATGSYHSAARRYRLTAFGPVEVDSKGQPVTQQQVPILLAAAAPGGPGIEVQVVGKWLPARVIEHTRTRIRAAARTSYGELQPKFFAVADGKIRVAPEAAKTSRGAEIAYPRTATFPPIDPPAAPTLSPLELEVVNRSAGVEPITPAQLASAEAAAQIAADDMLRRRADETDTAYRARVTAMIAAKVADEETPLRTRWWTLEDGERVGVGSRAAGPALIIHEPGGAADVVLGAAAAREIASELWARTGALPTVRGPLFAEVERLATAARNCVRAAEIARQRREMGWVTDHLESADDALTELLKLLANERADRLDAAIADQRKLNAGVSDAQ